MSQLKIRKPIYIIGGMGPQASADLYCRLIKHAAVTHNAIDNEDYPHIILESLAVPDFISNRARQNEAIVLMRQASARVELHDPAVVGMACNTAHLFADAVFKGRQLPFVSLIDTVANAVAAAGLIRVGLVASPTTIKTHLYQQALRQRGIELVIPSSAQLTKLERIIRKVIAGTTTQNDSNNLLNITLKLRHSGAQGIILGCTELPLIFPPDALNETIFDCLELLTLTLLKQYYNQ